MSAVSPLAATFIALNALYWAIFLARGVAGRRRGAAAATSLGTEPPGARLGYALHTLSIAVLYAAAVFDGRTTTDVRLALGCALAALCVGVTFWTMRTFRSWRLRARIDAGHVLSTDGPFALVRHPIYSAQLLLAAALLLFAPGVLALAGLVLNAAGALLRARAEERVLTQVFGAAYATYAARTARFLPGMW